MTKNIDEKLFFKIIRLSHEMRKEAGRGRGHRHCGPHGPHGHGNGEMHEPHEMHGHGERHQMHEPHGHGEMSGPRRDKMKAFAQNRVLMILLEHEDGVRQKVLSDEMHINPSSTSELISKLESEGYVKRTTDPDDKRATLISLTDMGRARGYEIEDERKERFGKAFANLSEKEKEQLLKLLDKAIGFDEGDVQE